MTNTLAPSRVLVTGATSWADREMVERLLAEYADRKSGLGGSFRIITGMADGADEFARDWAETNDVLLLAEPLELGEYPGPMHTYNDKMLGWAPELVLAFKADFDPGWERDECVAGTEHMARIAARRGIPVLLNGDSWLDTAVEVDQGRRMADANIVSMWGPTQIRIERGDITTLDVDVIVNAANRSLLGGGGVDRAIHNAAGPELLEACREVVARQGGCCTGEAVITRAGRLSANHVVHTVGPVSTGEHAVKNDALLARCYTESLRLGAEHGATSIAFPNISTGVYRFPKDRAAEVATTAVREWLDNAPHVYKEVVFVCFDQDNFDLLIAQSSH